MNKLEVSLIPNVFMQCFDDKIDMYFESFKYAPWWVNNGEIIYRGLTSEIPIYISDKYIKPININFICRNKYCLIYKNEVIFDGLMSSFT